MPVEQSEKQGFCLYFFVLDKIIRKIYTYLREYKDLKTPNGGGYRENR
jgi:hypothetical protein